MANAVEMSTMRKMVAQLNRYRHEYYNLNAPSVADDVYDYMYDELLALEEHTGVCMANSPTQTVGYPVVSALPKVAHDIPLLSLDKTKSIEDLIAFQAGRTVDLLLKLDGLTTELIYENGQLIRLSTRGDGYIGENMFISNSWLIAAFCCSISNRLWAMISSNISVIALLLYRVVNCLIR